PVVLHARPALEPHQDGFILVIFDEREPAPQRSEPAAEPPAGAESHAEGDQSETGQTEVDQLEADLDLSRQRMQGIIEEYETSQEELRASNEELQSSNEELRSTLEELETSKEELQSMNEELQTVNQENRHKVEELAQLTSDLQNLMAATQIATLFLDRDLRILRFTPQIGELFNVRHADRGRPLSDLTHRLGYDELQTDAQRVLDKLVPVEREVRDEAGHWYLIRVLPYRSTDDRIEGVVITFIDITTRKEAEESVRESEEQFRALVDASASMVWTTDPEGYVVEDSPSWRAFTGQTFNEWKGRGWLDAVHPDDRARAKQEWQDATETTTPFITEFRVHHAPTDAYRWTSVRAVPLAASDGSVRGWIGMNIDETQRKKAEVALRQSEARYRSLFESIDEGLCVVEVLFDEAGEPADYRFVETNPMFEEQTGLTDAVGKTARTLVPDLEEHWFRTYGEVARTGEPTRFTNGSEPMGRWFDVYAFRPLDAKPHHVAILFKDITTEKRNLEALREAKQTLEARVAERTEQVRDLASTLAMAEQDERRRIAQILHDDLQQLLFGIQLKMTFVRQGAEEATDATLAEHAEESERYLDRAIHVSRQLTVDLSPPVLEGEGLTQTLEWLTTQMEEVHNLTVEVLTEYDFVIPQEGMRVLLFQIVRELLFNVVKHADTDRATVTLDEADEGLIITVSDEGTGFDPATLKPKTEGGFGLFSVRERLRLYGGTLEIESAPGAGTRMTATIPAILAPPTEE
ncbi:MAG TPA: PAS domain S-box protein, partial [Longimicrobiales bacterium]|nr:PAS domain S-box protein [Longimicrobiales bacterium]